MSRIYSKKYSNDLQDEQFCAGNVTGHFRRTSSLRLRGEKMVQRSPLSTRKLIPVITENHQKERGDGGRPAENNSRPRSHVSVIFTILLTSDIGHDNCTMKN